MTDLRRISDGDPPACQVALCHRRASYKTTDVDGRPVYCCGEHRPLIAAMGRPSIPDDEPDQAQA